MLSTQMLQNRTSSSHTLYSSHCLNLSCFPMQRTSIVSCLHFSRGINDFTRYKTLYRLERLNRICWTATCVLSKKVLETIFFFCCTQSNTISSFRQNQGDLLPRDMIPRTSEAPENPRKSPAFNAPSQKWVKPSLLFPFIFKYPE